MVIALVENGRGVVVGGRTRVTPPKRQVLDSQQTQCRASLGRRYLQVGGNLRES